MEVGSRRETGAADLADHLALIDAVARRSVDHRHVGVERRNGSVAVDHDHRVAVATLPTGKDDAPILRCPDRIAGCCADVDASVLANGAENGMHARAEGRTDRSRCRHDVTLERW